MSKEIIFTNKAPMSLAGYNQEVKAGGFIFEVGQEKFRLNLGDSLLAPRKVPQLWAILEVEAQAATYSLPLCPRANGSFLSLGNESQCDAATRSRVVASP